MRRGRARGAEFAKSPCWPRLVSFRLLSPGWIPPAPGNSPSNLSYVDTAQADRRCPCRIRIYMYISRHILYFTPYMYHAIYGSRHPMVHPDGQSGIKTKQNSGFPRAVRITAGLPLGMPLLSVSYKTIILASKKDSKMHMVKTLRATLGPGQRSFGNHICR